MTKAGMRNGVGGIVLLGMVLFWNGCRAEVSLEGAPATEGTAIIESTEALEGAPATEGTPATETISMDFAEREELKQGGGSGKTPYFVDRLTPEAKGWGLSYKEPGMQPLGNASKEELAQYDAYFAGETEEKIIYLTFDCGYENGNTEAILDALQAHDVKAAFFVVGHYLESSPGLVKRMVEEGHTVGSHTYHHPDVNTLGEEDFLAEMDALQDKFNEVTGNELAMFYRPPEGKCGIENLTMAQDAGYTTIFWSLAYVDWDVEKQPTHKEAMEKLTGRIHPGAIVLLHNTSQTNGEILDELLTRWEEMGYRFATLSELSDLAEADF